MKNFKGTVLIFIAMLIGLLSASVSAAGITDLTLLQLSENSKTVYLTTDIKPNHFTADNSIISVSADFKGVMPTVSCKSSNTNVATTKIEKYDGVAYAYFFGKKAGTTTITTTVKYKGKTATYKTKLTIKKWVNPLSKLSIGSYSCLNTANKTNSITCGERKGKLSIKAKTGYTIKSMYVETTKKKTVKNGEKLDFASDPLSTDFYIKVQNNKTKEQITFHIKAY